MLFDCNLNLADGVGNVVAVQNIQINIDIDGVVAFNVSVDVVVFDDTRLVGVFPKKFRPFDFGGCARCDVRDDFGVNFRIRFH